MKKLKTGIKGLDALFHGGIQVESLTNNKGRDDSLVIVIKGERGTNKHLLAMQLMHGLSSSIFKRLKERDRIGIKSTAAYYSINKPEHVLNDMYLDLLVAGWIDAMTYAIKRRQTHIVDGDESKFYVSLRDNYRRAALGFWFNANHEDKSYPSPTFIRKDISRYYDMDYATMLANNVINYNSRTNSIHYRRILSGDSNNNLLFLRKYDTIADYIKDYDENNGDLHNYQEESERYVFDEELINVNFSFQSEQSQHFIGRNSQEAKSRFFSILRKIDEDIENREIYLEREKEFAKDNPEFEKLLEKAPKTSPFIHEVAVIDGFSHIDTETLKKLPYNHLHSQLRRYARVSILVFDDRKDVDIDCDICIELKKSCDNAEEYTYHELQISKCMFQTYAFGWHQYKLRDEGVVIFPSIHLLLQKRHYLPNRVHELGSSILENTYEQYLESKLHNDTVNGKLKDIRPGQMRDYANEFYFEDYQDSQEDVIEDTLRWMTKEYIPTGTLEDQVNESRTEASGAHNPQSSYNRLFSSAMFGFIEPKNESDQINRDDDCHIIGVTNHYPATAVVGNPNSFKRKFILGHALHWAQKHEHVLFVLFDKNEEDLRKNMICPGIGSRIEFGQEYCKQEADGKRCDKFDRCVGCNTYLHFIGVRPGCISPEELLAALLDQIRIYCDEDPELGIERRRLHIVIDDFQRIDFCFPFIRSCTLFTDALINVCREHNVELSILCDKSGERAREICTLADNVLCVERDEDNIRSLKVYIERHSDYTTPSAILKFVIKDIDKLFKCDKNGLSIDFTSGIEAHILGSMKEYWRQTWNTISQPSAKEGQTEGNSNSKTSSTK